jgi:hypothetical protein
MYLLLQDKMQSAQMILELKDVLWYQYHSFVSIGINKLVLVLLQEH